MHGPFDDGAGRRRKDRMAYRELTMIDVREVLRRWQLQQGIKEIARATGINRKTIRRYLTAAKALGVTATTELSDGVVHDVAQYVQARALTIPSEAWRGLEPHRDRIARWLDDRLRLSRVHALLARDGIEVTYATLRRFAIRELGWGAPKATVRLADPPAGQEAQIDFAEMGRVNDIESNRMRRLWVLLVTLSFSRYTFVWPTFAQTTVAIIEGLEAAWRFFRAMPKTLVPDNPTTMIVNADPTSPRLNEAFAEYVQARGLLVDPARVARPRDKARVERQVTYVRDGWFAGESCESLSQWRQSAETWCRDIAGLRVHGTTRKVPREVFDSIERAAMLEPPVEPFDVPIWVEAKVHPDHHVQVARALYSVPTAHLYKRVRVRTDSKVVRIYVGTELVKVHQRQPPGGRSTDPNDYPVGKSAYALRSVDALMARARDRGHHVGTYAERILGGPLPWRQMRAAYALLSLCDKYGDGRVEAVCQSALSFDVVDIKKISRMLKLGITRGSSAESANVVQLPLPSPRFARSDDHFRTQRTDKEKTR
jgi:transposase